MPISIFALDEGGRLYQRPWEPPAPGNTEPPRWEPLADLGPGLWDMAVDEHYGPPASDKRT